MGVGIKRALVLGLVMTVVMGISGCNFRGAIGTAGLGCVPSGGAIAADNRSHSINYSSLVSQTTDALDYIRQVIDLTDVNTSSAADSSTVDAKVMDAAYVNYCGYDWFSGGGEVIGLVTCVSLTSSNECEKHEVRIDQVFMQHPDVILSWERNVVLHEMLHSLGLNHLPGEENEWDVMYPSVNGIFTISPHNTDHIDGYY